MFAKRIRLEVVRYQAVDRRDPVGGGVERGKCGVVGCKPSSGIGFSNPA